VFGPDNTPAITTLDQARDDVAFAALAAMTQSLTQDFSVILEVLHAALSKIDERECGRPVRVHRGWAGAAVVALAVLFSGQ
jgi:hypothetical protein